MKIELVLKEYIDVNPSREMRCFVRNNVLIGTSAGFNFLPYIKLIVVRHMSEGHESL